MSERELQELGIRLLEEQIRLLKRILVLLTPASYHPTVGGSVTVKD